jgi:hypothetical protein
VCADRDRTLDHPNTKRAVLPAELFIANLVDTCASAFVARPGPTIATHVASTSGMQGKAKATPRARTKR